MGVVTSYSPDSRFPMPDARIGAGWTILDGMTILVLSDARLNPLMLLFQHFTRRAFAIMRSGIPSPRAVTMTTPSAASRPALAFQRWSATRNPDLRLPFALFGPDGQYHGSFLSEQAAHDYVDSVGDTEAWIGDGYAVFLFR